MSTAGIRYCITRRIWEMVSSVLRILATGWLALTLAFVALRILPGDAIQAQLTDAGLSATAIDERRAELGLDQPLAEQYFRYISDIVQGNFGYSLYTGEAVVDVIRDRAGSTVHLAAYGLLIMLALAILLGGCASRSDALANLAQFMITIAIGLPGYVTGTLLILVIGLADPDHIVGVLAAALILGFHTGGAIAQVLAVSIRQIRQQTYIMAAHGRGLRAASIETRHVWPNAILPVLPLIAVQAGFLLSGTVITEIVFARPGLGRLMLDAVQRRDLPVVQSLVLLGALVYGLCLLVAEFLTRVIDPRPT
jgi:ABC-type dipeptide/oligopeptide/nickel transport system permease component